MELKSGTIHSFEDGTVKTGHFVGKPYKTITLTTGNKLTCFDLDFIEGIEIGREYTFPVEQKGSYTNIVCTVTTVIQTGGMAITDVSPVTGLAKDAEEVRAFVEPVYEHIEKNIPKIYSSGNKDEAIRKAVALKAAVEFLVGQSIQAGDQFSVGDVIETAKKFEEYLK